ncbi:TonB-dependent receptor [Pinibacter soli]|uniref:TonB-dependent receptor n=1 Tax=Pinibacter soli TaxID=3044211 RepID=A0ABT6R9L2_9BACT|nr:TonB-dependent receptor [Pinibacter soli]MDI3319171.1 TonB-dependent receptor [Pinibacter soli]
MKKLFFLSFLFTSFCDDLQSQTSEQSKHKHTIKGIVKDELTGNGLAGASIYIHAIKAGVLSNEQGSFAIVVPDSGKYEIEITTVGYRKKNVTGNAPATIHIELTKTSASLEEVVITGVSKATLIRENPIPIATVSSVKIEKTIESNIIDVLMKNVPGLNTVKTGPNISKPFIRGLGYNRVLTLYDGIRQEGQQWGDEHGIEVDAYNIEKAEVIKGPSSLMFGSDALAGVVSLFPNVPKDKDGKLKGKFTTEYQSNNGLVGNGLRLNYSNDHWLYALRGSYRFAKNYTNPVDSRVYNTGFSEKNFAALAGYNNGKFSSTLNFTLYDNLQGIPDGSRDSVSRKFTKQVREGSIDDIVHRPVVTDAELNSYGLSPLHQHIQHYRIYNNTRYDFGNGNMEVLLGLQQNIRREFSHPTAPKQAALFVRLNTLNYNIKYNTHYFSNVDLSVGINGMAQNNRSMDATDFPIPDYNLLDIGSYICASWKYKKWTLSGGIRYDLRSMHTSDMYIGANPDNGFNKQFFLPDTAGSVLQFPALQKTFTGVSLSAGATYKLTEKISIKANIAKGYRAPNITELASNGLDPGAHIIYLGNSNFSPEFNLQEDIGIDFSAKDVTASISVFNNNVQNYIYFSQLTDGAGNPLTDAQGNKTFQYLQEAAQLYGIEASLSIHPQRLKGFMISNHFSAVYGFNKNNNYKGKGVDGEYLPFIPPVKLLSSISQEIKIKSSLIPSLSVQADIDYNGRQDRFLQSYNTETASEAFTLFNASVSTVVNYSKKSSLQFLLQVNNIFNTSFQSGLSRLKYFEYYSQSPNDKLGIYGMGRNACVKMIVPF